MTLSINELPATCLGKILSYNLDASNLLETVSKCFRAALQKAMQAEWREMSRLWSMPAPFSVTHLEERSQALEGIRKTIAHRLESWKIDRPHNFAPQQELDHYKTRMNAYENFRCLSRREVVFLDEERELLSVKFPALYAQVVARWERHSHLVLDMLSERDEELDFQEADKQVTRFLKEEGFAFRERKVRLIEKLDPEKADQIKRCFTKLYREQKEICSLQPFWRSVFAKLPLIFCAQCRLDAEDCVQSALCETDEDLRNMWANMRVIYQWYTLPAVALPPDAPQAGAPASQIRAWMNSPANSPLLDKLQQLYLGKGAEEVGGGRWLGVYAIPREIVKCRNLNLLNLGEVEELPDFLAELRYLNSINTIRQPGDRCTVMRISDRAYRHMEPSLPLGYENIQLDESKLKEIPFRKWFKDIYCVPYLSFIDPILKFLEDREEKNDCITVLCSLSLSVAFLLQIPTQIAIFFYNLFVSDIIEPIITFARDRLGYSRMVKIGGEE